MQDEGYKVYTAEDGINGLLVYEERDPDIVVLDLIMPRMNGTEVLQELKKNYRDPKVIIASASQEKRHEAMKQGAYDFIEKPIDLDQLLDSIENALNNGEKGLIYKTIKDTSNQKPYLKNFYSCFLSRIVSEDLFVFC